MNQKNKGEQLFERYLESHEHAYTYETPLSETPKLVDFVVEHVGRKLLFEVKEINVAPPSGRAFAFDPHGPIERHIHAGAKKFRKLEEYTCAIVLAAGEGSFVDLHSPHVVLGAMYGRWGWSIPFNPQTGQGRSDLMEGGFIGEEGQMRSKHGHRNTRVAAVISVMNYHVGAKEAALFIDTDDGRTREERYNEVWNGVYEWPDPIPCVTVWENAFATRRLPQSMFRGEMDAWWSPVGNEQVLSFVGDRRMKLKIDRSVR